MADLIDWICAKKSRSGFSLRIKSERLDPVFFVLVVGVVFLVVDVIFFVFDVIDVNFFVFDVVGVVLVVGVFDVVGVVFIVFDVVVFIFDAVGSSPSSFSSVSANCSKAFGIPWASGILGL